MSTGSGTPCGALAVGAVAPVLDLPNTHGTPVRVGGARPRPQLVVFLPLAFTPTCSGELRELDSVAAALAPVDVVAVSCDPGPAQRVWAEQQETGVVLLSDFWPHGRAAGAFGAFNEVSGSATRSSFQLDTDGRVCWTLHHPPGRPRPLSAYLETRADS